MKIIDNDLLSIQEARILTENAREAQKELALVSQERLDDLTEHLARVMHIHAEELAYLSVEETDFGIWQDKMIKNRFICENLPRKLRGMRCVGVIDEHPDEKVVQVGVPKGVVCAVCPATNPVSTIIYKTLISLKSGNAVIFALHPRSKKTMQRTLEYIIAAVAEKGFPEGTVSYLSTVSDAGTREVMQSEGVATIILTDVAHMLEPATRTGKQVIVGTMGNNPVFIEKTADLAKAARDVVTSKTFDNGIIPGVEQSLVVEGSVAAEVRQHLINEGAYFMSADEENRLAKTIFNTDGSYKPEMIGKSAKVLARRAGFEIPANATLLIAEKKYVSHKSPYTAVKYGPVLAYYIEDDWQHACEKCIEVLLDEGKGHSLSIHSQDQAVLLQFALKKPVGRMLINTPAALGSIGMTTNIFPAMTLGSGATGTGVTSDNVSPMNLVYVRKVAYGVCDLDRSHYPNNGSSAAAEIHGNGPATSELSPEMSAFLCRLLKTMKGDKHTSCNREELQALHEEVNKALQILQNERLT